MGIYQRNYTVFACSLMFFWNIGLRMVFFALVPVMAKDIGFNVSQAGLLVGIFYFGYAASVWGSAFLPGRRKTLIITGTIVTLVFTLLLAVCRTFPLMLILAPLCGAGAGFYIPRGVSLIADASEDNKRGRNLSFHEVAAGLGMMIGPLYAGIMLAHWDWRGILIGWGLGSIVTVGLILGVVESSIVLRSDLKAVFHLNRFFFYFIVVGGCIFLVVVGITSVLPMIMTNVWHLDPAYAASYLGVTRVAGVFGPLVGGSLSDRWGRRKVLKVFFAISVVSLCAMIFLNFGWVFTSLWVLLIITTNGSIPVWITSITEAYASAAKDKAVGMINGSASLLGSVLTPPFLGLLLQHFPLPVTFGTAALAMLAGILVISHWPISFRQLS